MHKVCFIGIDPSINGTGITIFHRNCYYFYIICKTKKSYNLFNSFGCNITPFLINTKKYYFEKILFANSILNLAISNLELYNCSIYCGIEGYSYGSHGKLAEIGELCGILKYHLFRHSKIMEVESFPPTIVKKFGAGYGQSGKGDLVLEFCEMFPNFYKLRYREELKDLVDSFYITNLTIAKYLLKYTNKQLTCIKDKKIKKYLKELIANDCE